MKKGFWFIICGALLILLQVASLVFDLMQGGLKFVPLTGGNALMYNVSYISAGLAGIVLILWGITVSRRKE